ncbi:MAG: Y-family DNA polymerase [Eubacteriales bacterium]
MRSAVNYHLTAMPKWQAQKLLPQAIFISPDHRLYFDFSVRIINIMKQFSPLVEWTHCSNQG